MNNRMLLKGNNKPVQYISIVSYLLAAFCALLLHTCLAQGKAHHVDIKLKASLDSIHKEDQRYRALVDNLTERSSDSLARVFHLSTDSVYDPLMAMQGRIDITNLAYVENIIRQWGYPGISLVGSPANEVVFYVIQHSPKIKEYLPLLQDAARKKELSATLVAMMEDRLLTEEEKDQIYGTQLWGNAVKDAVTGISKPELFFNPIKDPEHVNERRRKAGFKTTIEQYAKEMQVAYRIKRPWWWKQ